MITETPLSFAERLATDGQRLVRGKLETLQLNLGRMCNLACSHCHVEAGPKRTEIMPWEVMERVLGWVDGNRSSLGSLQVDLTGGAPEMNPSFRRLVRELSARGLPILDRCNLTILLEPGFEDIVDFLADHRVEIVASLPCYLSDNVDRQRGNGVYAGSIRALRLLNAAGYGRGDTGLKLDLVYNPVGFALPPDQATLEQDYKRELARRAGVVFDHLWTITNMPIRRFAHQLQRTGEYDNYLDLLRDAHGAGNVDNVMCRSLLSIDWLGGVYDCDFNQMLDLPLVLDCDQPKPPRLWELNLDELSGRDVCTGEHCFGCTAGSGSSCQGALG